MQWFNKSLHKTVEGSSTRHIECIILWMSKAFRYFRARWNKMSRCLWPSTVCTLHHRGRPGERFLPFENIPLNLRSKRATLLLLTWIYFSRLGGTVNFILQFMTNVAISISISQIFRSRVAINQLHPPMVSWSHRLYDMPGMGPRMNVLFWGRHDF